MSKRIPTGRVFRKVYRDRHGCKQQTSTWILKYYDENGKAVEVSSGTDNYDDALTDLRDRMAKVSRRGSHGGQPERVFVGQLLDLLIEDYRYKEHKSTYDTELRVNAHLRPFFGDMKAQAVSTVALKMYVAHRRKEKAEAATINKEFAWLRRAMKIGAMHEPALVLRVPHFEMLSVDNVREGVLGHDQYRAVRDALPRHGRIALVIAYHTGARKGEIRAIRKDKIDMKAGHIYLPGRTTKNGRPRYLPIYGEMGAELSVAIAKGDRQCPLLVERDGKSVLNFKKAWATACAAAGIPDALFHDLRRTAATNMIEAGLTEKEVMEITGHRTRAIFDRYHIISDRRMKENADKLAEHLKGKEPVAKTGPKRVTKADPRGKTRGKTAA